ncbi:hypothetical protein HYT60_01470 [Candidatus Woesebacteria bacterium]|nr:hypothetical protein [Candidatus Woesebacteria bacterium]
MTSDRNFETGQAGAAKKAADEMRALRNQVLAVNTYNKRLALAEEDPRVLAAAMQAGEKNPPQP